MIFLFTHTQVLDTNRELYIHETQRVVRAHPNFRVFATQNPVTSGAYGGRHQLSRAFRCVVVV
jgi:midasin